MRENENKIHLVLELIQVTLSEGIFCVHFLRHNAAGISFIADNLGRVFVFKTKLNNEINASNTFYLLAFTRQ